MGAQKSALNLEEVLVAAGTSERQHAPWKLKSPFYLFLVFIATLPFEAALVLEVGFTIRLSYIALAALVGVVLAEWAVKGPSGSFRSPLGVSIGVYLVVSALSLLMGILSPPPSATWAPEVRLRGSEFRSLIQVAFLYFSSLAYFLTVYFCSGVSRLLLAVRLYVFCATALAGYGIYQFCAYIFDLPFVDITNALGTGGDVYHASTYGSWLYFRSHGTFQEPLNFGHYLLSAFFLPFTLWLYGTRSATGEWRLFRRYSFPLLLLGVALVLTRSRGALIGFAAGVVTLLLFAGWRAIMRILTAAAAILGVVWLSPEAHEILLASFLDRFGMHWLMVEPRFQTWNFLLNLFSEHPVLGVGLGNYAIHWAAATGAGVPGSAFGIYWQALVDTGLVGFVALGLVLLRFYQVLLSVLSRTQRTPWHPYALGFLASFTATMVQYATFGDRLGMYVWVMMGAAMAMSKQIKVQRERTP